MRLPFAYSIAAKERREHSYMLAIHRNSTDTTALMPVHAYTLLPSVVSHRGLHNGDDEPELTMEQQRARLGMTFGTKKAQKRIAALARNKIDVATEDLVELQPTLLDKIDAATASLPTVEKMKQESDAARPVPLYDVDATDPKRIYSQDDVVPPHEVKAVPLFGLLEAKTQEDRVKLLPFKRSRFVNDRLNAVVNEFGEVAPSGKQKKQLRLLYLVSAFMAFRAKKDGKQGPRTRLDDMGVPPAIITSVADRFSEKTKTGKACVSPYLLTDGNDKRRTARSRPSCRRSSTTTSSSCVLWLITSTSTSACWPKTCR